MSRKLSDDEVTQAIDLLKGRDPVLWERYIGGERMYNSIDDDTSSSMIRIMLEHFFPEETIIASPMVMEVVWLLSAIRHRVRAALGLKWEEGNLSGYKSKRL